MHLIILSLLRSNRIEGVYSDPQGEDTTQGPNGAQQPPKGKGGGPNQGPFTKVASAEASEVPELTDDNLYIFFNKINEGKYKSGIIKILNTILTVFWESRESIVKAIIY